MDGGEKEWATVSENERDKGTSSLVTEVDLRGKGRGME